MLRKHSTIFDFVMPGAFVLLTVMVGLAVLRLQYGSWWTPQASLLYADAGWYHSIVRNGYVFKADAANNTAFFPLFPYSWKFLGFSPAVMSIFNALVFTFSAGLLFRAFRASWKVRILFLSLTLLLFYATPMSEALFFFFSTLLLIGLQRSRLMLILVGIIGAGMCRSVSTVFFPAFVIIGLFAWLRSRERISMGRYLLFALVSVVTLIGVFTIHYLQTGEFWAFAHTQQYWYARFQMPDIPFSTWKPEENGYLDQFAVLLGFTAAGYLLSRLVKAVKSGKTIGDAALFALLYMSGTIVLMLFTKGGGFNSVNRYLLSTAFFYLFLREVASFGVSRGGLVGYFLFAVVYYLVCWHMGVSVQKVFVFLAVLTMIFLLFQALKKDTRLASVFLLIFSILAICIQGILWSRFVTHVWVG